MKDNPHNKPDGKSQPAKRKPSQLVKWAYRPLTSTILVCACGNKYIATREGQTACVFCVRKEFRDSAHRS